MLSLVEIRGASGIFSVLGKNYDCGFLNSGKGIKQIMFSLPDITMEESWSTSTSASACIVLIVLLTLTCAWRVLNWLWLRPKRLERLLRDQGLQGNPYSLFNGDLKQIMKMQKEVTSKPMKLSHDIAPRVFSYHLQSIIKHGKNPFIWFGRKPRVIITEPELIKEVLNKIYAFPKPDTNPLVKLVATGLLNYEGEKWNKHRRIVSPAFNMEKLKNMLPIFFNSCNDLIIKWEEMSSDGSCEIDLWPFLQSLTSDVIARAAFGSSYEEGRRIFELLKEQAQLAAQSMMKDYIPGWRFIPTAMHRRMKEINREIKASLTDLINNREKALEVGETTENDLLCLLLESNHKEIEEHGNSKTIGMSIEEVTMILNEVLRLYSPVIGLNRNVDEDVKLGNLSLPAGVQVSLPTIMVHHSPELWGDDADSFNPERFSEGVLKATNGRVSFFPFGWGPRVCVGQNFSMLEAKMALSMILQHFTFELSPAYAHAPVSVITLQPQYGAHVILRKLQV
ncbi:hypothetical protein V8G54_021568 [Vigna mungo]|uniref:Cytochrome P450 n=1 Tax=Vigna mungo TaxID=3915 RepID=A0AAQ3RVW3_VIGMU